MRSAGAIYVGNTAWLPLASRHLQSQTRLCQHSPTCLTYVTNTTCCTNEGLCTARPPGKASGSIYVWKCYPPNKLALSLFRCRISVRSCQNIDVHKVSDKVTRSGLENSGVHKKELASEKATWRHNVVGHELSLKLLEGALAKNRVAPTYLFYGPRGVGKHYVALQFAYALMGVASPRADQGGGPSQADLALDLWDYGSLHSYGSAVENDGDPKVMSLDEVRSIGDFLTMGEWIRRKVAILDADCLSERAANILLKVLEERPGTSVVILVATNIDALPNTVISRCVKVPFRPLDPAEAVTVLRRAGEQGERLILAAGGHPSGGRPRPSTPPSEPGTPNASDRSQQLPASTQREGLKLESRNAAPSPQDSTWPEAGVSQMAARVVLLVVGGQPGYARHVWSKVSQGSLGALLPDVLRTSSDIEALQAASRIAGTCEVQEQLVLVSFLQLCCWAAASCPVLTSAPGPGHAWEPRTLPSQDAPTLDVSPGTLNFRIGECASLLEVLEVAHQALLANVNPRLAWEAALMRMVALRCKALPAKGSEGMQGHHGLLGDRAAASRPVGAHQVVASKEASQGLCGIPYDRLLDLPKEWADVL
eukprot:jgi/Mesvir1/2851/Mv13937-RA.1